MTIYLVKRTKEGNTPIDATELGVGEHTIAHKGAAVPIHVLEGDVVRVEPKKLPPNWQEEGQEGRVTFHADEYPHMRSRDTLLALQAFEIPPGTEGDRLLYIHGYDVTASVEYWSTNPMTRGKETEG